MSISNSSNSKSNSIFYSILIWGLVALFYFYDNLLQVSPSAMKPELTLAFTKDAEQFGSLSAYCLYAYGLMQLPAGMLLDRFGPRKVITFACILCALGSLIFGLSDTLWLAKLGRVLIGGGAAFALLCCLKILTIWFPRQRYAFMIGMTVMIGYLGGAFGLAFVSKAVELVGWRETLYWGAAFGFVLSLFLWGIVKEKNIQKKSEPMDRDSSSTSSSSSSPSDSSLSSSSNSSSSSLFNRQSFDQFWQDFSSILKNRQTWIAALFAGLVFVPTLALGGLWGIPFLVEAHGFERDLAGICVSFIYLGWVFGGSFWGFVSDYLGRRNLPMQIATVVTLLLTLAIIYLDHLSLPVLKGLFFALGFFSSNFIVAFAVIAESNPERLAATASGFANGLNTLWGALAQPFIGLLLDLSSSSSGVKAGSTSFSLAQYQSAFLTLPVCLGISMIFLLMLKETYCGRAQTEDSAGSSTEEALA